MQKLRDAPVWKEAAAALARAQHDPSPTTVESAREALAQLANEAGVLVSDMSVAPRPKVTGPFP